MKNKLTYASTGVKYDTMDPMKRLAQKEGKKTSKNLEKFGMQEVNQSRGDSAFVWEEKDSYRALVMEGLGTKNRVADEVAKTSNKTFYDAIAQDTVAMIINDLIVVGASPQVLTAYFAVGNSDWFLHKKRAEDLIKGWAKACNLAGVVWGGGETPTLKDIVENDSIDLAGSATGIIRPKKRLTLGQKLVSGDCIVLIESNGIHANGLTLARSIADSLPRGYNTKLSNEISYGESLLQPTHVYSKFIADLFSANVDIHYMVNITGHGWRKLMRSTYPFSYHITTIPPISPLFEFIQKHSGCSDAEMYGNFNMGAGFALFVPHRYFAAIERVAKMYHFSIWEAGTIETGKKEITISPKKITFGEDTLAVR